MHHIGPGAAHGARKGGHGTRLVPDVLAMSAGLTAPQDRVTLPRRTTSAHQPIVRGPAMTVHTGRRGFLLLAPAVAAVLGVAACGNGGLGRHTGSLPCLPGHCAR